MTKKLVNIRIPLPADTGLHGEVMWAEPLGGRRYRLSNIPFHAYNLNLGDIVHASVSVGDCSAGLSFHRSRQWQSDDACVFSSHA